jgi:hypothetical protein
LTVFRKSRLIAAGAALAACAVIPLASGAPAGAATHPRLPSITQTFKTLKGASAPKFARPGGITVIGSVNWAGYAASGTTFRSVSAEMSVPSVNCTATPDAFSYHWVGLDGLADSTVEQDGVASFCYEGAPYYWAWSEMYPAAPVVQYDLKPGDAVKMSAALSAGVYTLAVADVTSGQHFTTRAGCGTAGACRNTSAEVISEGYPDEPYYGGTADYGLAGYLGISLTDTAGITGNFTANTHWGIDELEQFGASGLDALPSALEGGQAFLNAWHAEN